MILRGLESRCVTGRDNALTIVAPAAPGGGWDQTARVMQQVLTTLDRSAIVQVENVPGAAGTIGLARFVSAERGNPNALLVTGLVMVSAITSNRAPVSLANTTPIARLTGEFEVIVVPAASPFRTLGNLLDAFKAAPTAIAWGGGSAGGTDDLLVRLIADAVGVAPNRANYIAFSGGGAALAALLGEQVTAGVSGYGEFAGQIESGALRALAISAPVRVAGLDVPTLREQGVALDLSNWRAVVAPPGITEVERDRLIERVEAMARSSQWRDVLQRNGWSDLLLTGVTFRQFLISEQQRVDGVLRRLQADSSQRATAFAFTPMTLPAAALAALGVLTLVLIATRMRQSRPCTGDASVAPTSYRPLQLVALLAIHAVAFSIVGFIPASTTLFIVAARLLGSHRWIRDLGIGAITSTILYVAFTLGLGLSLPADPITRWVTR